MNKAKLNILIDIFSLIFFLVSLISGIIVWTVLPSGSGFQGGRDLAGQFLGLPRHDWVSIHTISSLIFVIITICHHVLHWNWFKNLPKIIRG